MNLYLLLVITPLIPSLKTPVDESLLEQLNFCLGKNKFTDGVVITLLVGLMRHFPDYIILQVKSIRGCQSV